MSETEKPQYVKDWEACVAYARRTASWATYTALSEDGPAPAVNYAALLEEWEREDSTK